VNAKAGIVLPVAAFGFAVGQKREARACGNEPHAPAHTEEDYLGFAAALTSVALRLVTSALAGTGLARSEMVSVR
jgi:hypothetical protein